MRLYLYCDCYENNFEIVDTTTNVRFLIPKRKVKITNRPKNRRINPGKHFSIVKMKVKFSIPRGNKHYYYCDDLIFKDYWGDMDYYHRPNIHILGLPSNKKISIDKIHLTLDF